MFSKIPITILIALSMLYEASAETNVNETKNLSEELKLKFEHETVLYYNIFTNCLKLYVKKLLLNDEAMSKQDDKVLEFLIRKLLATNSFSKECVRILERLLRMVLMRETIQKANNDKIKVKNPALKHMHWRQGRFI
jgi:hypothetical protein